jgi:ATP/maltotriose-dependent transcriptional regulator MalT
MAEPAPLVESLAADALPAGRDALKRHAWQEAFDLLSRADEQGDLSGVDLEALAEAAFFAARPDAELPVKERAFKVYQAEGNPLRAAYLALRIAATYGYAGKASIASAWTRRAERLLEASEETYAHGYLALVRSDVAKAAGDIEAALQFAEDAARIGMHAGHPDLQAFALTDLGALKIATGATNDGFALMEEASISAVSGELSPYATGLTTCQMISACRDLTDYRRASE